MSIFNIQYTPAVIMSSHYHHSWTGRSRFRRRAEGISSTVIVVHGIMALSPALNLSERLMNLQSTIHKDLIAFVCWYRR